jgi:hypothetical protein
MISSGIEPANFRFVAPQPTAPPRAPKKRSKNKNIKIDLQDYGTVYGKGN